MKVVFYACPNCSRTYEGEVSEGFPPPYCKNKGCYDNIVRKITLYLPRLSFMDGYGFQEIKVRAPKVVKKG